MQNKKLFSHFQQLKNVDRLPAAILLSCASSLEQARTFGTQLLQMLHCPKDLDCEENCSACKQFSLSNQDLFFHYSHTAATGRDQIAELFTWTKLRTAKRTRKFVLIPNLERLAHATATPLLKWIENLPSGVIVLAFAQQTHNVYPPLLSRFTQFDFSIPPTTVKNFEHLSPHHQYIFQKWMLTTDSTQPHLLEEKFLPLVTEVDLFFRYVCTNKPFAFLNEYNEELVLGNFWTFASLALIYAIGFLNEEPSIIATHRQPLSPAVATKLSHQLRRQMNTHQDLQNLTANSTNVKLSLLSLLSFLAKSSAAENIRNDSD